MSSEPPSAGGAGSDSLQPPLEANPTASSAESTSASDDIRRQVEQEQALTDAQKRSKELEGEVEKLKNDNLAIQGEKDGACKCDQPFHLIFVVLSNFVLKLISYPSLYSQSAPHPILHDTIFES